MTGGRGPPKRQYTVLREAAMGSYPQSGAVFMSDHMYVLPGAGLGLGTPEGAASILSKLGRTGRGDSGVKRVRTMADKDEADELGKKFKF